MHEVTCTLQAIGRGAMPLLLFITAFEAYAICTFEAHAFAHLPMPFDVNCFYAVLDRARIQLQAAGRGGEERREALQVPLRSARASQYSEVFAIRAGERDPILRTAR
jgi:DNA-binding LytR/AlgR family response regulator